MLAILAILAILMTCDWDRRGQTVTDWDHRGQTVTDWDACFWTFSHIVRIGDRKNPRLLPFLGHMRTSLNGGARSWMLF